MRNVLVIEDNMLISNSYKAAIDHFLKLGVNVLQAYTADDGRIRARNDLISVFVIDVHLPDGDGIKLAEELRKDYPFTPIIIATDKNDPNFIAAVHQRIKNIAFLTKPFEMKALIAEIQYAIAMLNQTGENNYLVVKIDSLSQAIPANNIVKIEKCKGESKYEILLYDDRTERFERIYFYAEDVDSIFKKFTNPQDFIQCNRGCIINKSRKLSLDRKNKIIYLKPNIAVDIGGKKFKDAIYDLF